MREDLTLADGTTLATWTTGTASDLLPVVLVHGGPGLWDHLAPLAALMDSETLVHRYDQRGCGRSTGANVDDLTVERSVADLEELRRTWGHDRWIVIGHSAGADLAVAYASAHPEAVAAVGHLDGTGVGDWQSVYRVERARREGEEAAARRRALDGLASRTREEEIERRTLCWATDYADAATGRALAREMAAEDLPINRVANRRLRVEDADLIASVARFRGPMWFVHGAADPRPVGPVMDLAARAAVARKRIIEGAGHLPWTEQPERTREVLLEVLHSAR